jgi:hypothetical protein
VAPGKEGAAPGKGAELEVEEVLDLRAWVIWAKLADFFGRAGGGVWLSVGGVIGALLIAGGGGGRGLPAIELIGFLGNVSDLGNLSALGVLGLLSVLFLKLAPTLLLFLEFLLGGATGPEPGIATLGG